MILETDSLKASDETNDVLVNAGSKAAKPLCDKSLVHTLPRKETTSLVLGSLSLLGYHVALLLAKHKITVVAVENIGSIPFSDTTGVWHDRSVSLSGQIGVEMIWKDYCNQSAVQELLKSHVVSYIFFIPDLTSLKVHSTHLHGALLHCSIDILEAMREFPATNIVLLLPVDMDSRKNDLLHQTVAAEILESAVATYAYLYKFPSTVIHTPISEDAQMSDHLSDTLRGTTLGSYVCKVHSLPLARYKRHSVNRKDPDAGDRVIFTSYFTSSFDPQRARKRKANQFKYMKSWYDSVNSLAVRAVVFHDDLDSNFIEKLRNNNIEFHRVLPSERSTNDARFYAWYQYLIDHPTISHVLLSDISDVRYQKDPFDLMDLLGDWLYIGQDIDLFPNMESMPWLMKRLRQCFGDKSVDSGEVSKVKKLQFVYNAGVIGGPRGLMLTFLHHVINILDFTPSHLNCNMAVVNYIAHKYFDDHIFTGFPLTSRFMAQQSNPKAVYVIHK
jgi:succinate dehydrogenase hydrophobic anchor subunit